MEFKGFNENNNINIDSNWLVESIMNNVNKNPMFKKLLNNKLGLYLKIKNKRVMDQETSIINIKNQIKKYDDEITDLNKSNYNEVSKLKNKLTI